LKGPCPRPLDDGADVVARADHRLLEHRSLPRKVEQYADVGGNGKGMACCTNNGHDAFAMIHFHKLRQELFAPSPAREAYVKREPGRGWPEECPPIRAANSFGFDLLANFDITFVRARNGAWRVEPDVVIESDFDWAATDDAPGVPLRQQYAWFWQRGQKIPHDISDNVFAQIRNQVKVSSFLFFKTDPNELLLMTALPNQPPRAWRTLSGLVDTDWYPASYPWHIVLELDPKAKRIHIAKGEPLCRVIPVRRDTYFAQEMSQAEFDEFFTRGQQWLATHGRVGHDPAGDVPADGTMDITHTYVRQQMKSRFVVIR
jgi:hypothetical protein